jgi:uncharacterized protein with HEPN domain
MEKSNKIYLEDILSAIKLVLEDYVAGFDFDKFNKNRKTQDAVIRQIAIIGEAMGKLNEDFISSHPELPVKETISMRNILVHDYDWVDTEEVWKTVQKDLPELRKIIKEIIQKEL